ncbi:DUF2171 domain-containing protein [soil metagenome]
MVASSNIKDRMDVVCSCGTNIGKVDHVEGDTIKLTKNDSSDGRHHYIPTDWVESVGKTVVLNRNLEEAMEEWTDEPAMA